MTHEDFEARFLDLAKDGKHRTLKQIQEALEIPRPIDAICGLLVLESRQGERETRLRCTVLRGGMNQQAWWVEEKKA